MPEDKFKAKVVLALIVKNGKFLLIRRKVPSMKVEWTFPGGVTRKGETDEEAVIREADEEVNLNVTVQKKLLERKHPNTLVPITYFHCTLKDSQAPKIGQPHEIAEIEWVKADEVINRFTSDTDPIIQKFISSFSS